MPTTDPAARLRQAATKLRTMTADVPPPPWTEGGIGDYGWTVHLGAPTDPRWASIDTCMDDEQGKTITRYIAAMGPLVGEGLAAVFDQWAWLAERDPDLLYRVGGPETLAVADALLGEATR
jgi:hypothetical protein